MATQPVLDFSGTPFLDCMSSTSRDRILANSTKIRYAAGTIAFQPGDPDRADILEPASPAFTCPPPRGGRRPSGTYIRES
jgi:hypothetical protein